MAMIELKVIENHDPKHIRSVLQYNHDLLKHEGPFIECQDPFCKEIGRLILWLIKLENN